MKLFFPSKVDKRGRRFGFVHFVDVSDPEEFGKRLDMIFIGDQKLYADISRFSRGKWGEPNVRRNVNEKIC